MDLTKSRICPILGKSDPRWAQISKLCTYRGRDLPDDWDGVAPDVYGQLGDLQQVERHVQDTRLELAEHPGLVGDLLLAACVDPTCVVHHVLLDHLLVTQVHHVLWRGQGQRSRSKVKVKMY